MQLQKAAGGFGDDVKEVRHVMFGVLNSADNLSTLHSRSWKASVGAEDQPYYWRRGLWWLVVSISHSVLAKQTNLGARSH